MALATAPPAHTQQAREKNGAADSDARSASKQASQIKQSVKLLANKG